jgi:hypothetical protein
MNIRQLTLSSAATLALCLTASAGGQNAPSYSHHGYNSNWAEGWYIGAGANWDASQSAKLPTVDMPWDESQYGHVTSFEKSENGTGFDVYVGRKVSNHFAFEVGYTWLGQQEFRSTGYDLGIPGCKDICTQTAQVNQWNVHGVGLVKWPIGDYFDVFAKGGIAYYVNTTDLDGGLSTQYPDPNPELSTFALTYGAGLELSYEQFGIRGEYTVVAPNFNNQEDYYISDIIGASLFYRFM